MNTTRLLRVTVSAIIILLAGCVTLGSERLQLSESTFSSQYDKIKAIVADEASKNGFGQLTSEVKPSEFNGWKGQMYFSLQTPNGTDQLFVEFARQGFNVSVYMHGAGTRANPDSATKAIATRLRQL